MLKANLNECVTDFLKLVSEIARRYKKKVPQSRYVYFTVVLSG